MEHNKNKISFIEKALLDGLAGVAGIVIAVAIWDMSLNLILYHSLFTPKNLSEGVNLGGGFAVMLTAPELLILLPVCVIALVKLFRKLR